MALFLYLCVYLKMSFRPMKKFKQCSLVEITESDLSHPDCEEFEKVFQWNHFISWREELPFTREVQQGACDPRGFLHILWCILFSAIYLFIPLQLAIPSMTTSSLLFCLILNLGFCSCFQYLCSSIVCIAGYFTVRSLVGIEN